MIGTSATARGTVLAMATVLGLGGCGVDGLGGPAGQPLLGALLQEDTTAVEVEFSGCDSSPEVEVVESASTVRITVAGPNGGCEPVHELVVQLDGPLGDRTLVDGATGDEVEVTRP